MVRAAHGCAFCGAQRQLATTHVLDPKWLRRFGGAPAVTLDHGWYRRTTGERIDIAEPDAAGSFPATLKAACDPCVRGWMEDVAWRAEPAALALADRRQVLPGLRRQAAPLLRWARLTALLVDLLPGVPSAVTAEQRHQVRIGAPDVASAPVWLTTTLQRLPARVHLSQVTARDEADFVQLVSVDIAHLSALVVLAGTEGAADVLVRSALVPDLGPSTAPDDDLGNLPVVDLARHPSRHGVAVHRLCSTASARRRE